LKCNSYCLRNCSLKFFETLFVNTKKELKSQP
jgi:hypothetical protein